MKKVKTMMTAVIALALISAYPILAQKAERGHQKEKMRSCKAMGTYCIHSLTTEQISKIQKLKLEHQKEILPLRQKMQTIHLELRALISEGADQKKLEAKIDESGKIRTEIQKKALAHHQEIRKLLTDEQKVYFDLRCSGMGHGCGGCNSIFNGR
ncbi:MAG: periplasmic heavy metal sensor [Candidatus Aminicenantes bacterium]|nr:periplasmic heavy metal sensor [Candidatus Aminicenantes bacterium]